MSRLEELQALCPYCNERLDILVDPTDTGQQYIEDCQVCCRPMVIRAAIGFDGEISIDVRSEDEV